MSADDRLWEYGKPKPPKNQKFPDTKPISPMAALGFFLIMATVVSLPVAHYIDARNALAAQETPAHPVLDVLSDPLTDAIYEAARSYGRGGCGDFTLAVKTARAALKANVPAGTLAAQVATESHCNPLAVSPKGAVGLMQIVPHVWEKEYDFSSVNLLNADDSLRVGAEILARKIKEQPTLKKAVAKYNGAGPDAEAYANKVTRLSQ